MKIIQIALLKLISVFFKIFLTKNGFFLFLHFIKIYFIRNFLKHNKSTLISSFNSFFILTISDLSSNSLSSLFWFLTCCNLHKIHFLQSFDEKCLVFFVELLCLNGDIVRAVFVLLQFIYFLISLFFSLYINLIIFFIY